MDPIHPILPVTDRIPVVTVVPRIERSKRRRRDDDPGDQGRRRSVDEERSGLEDDEDLDAVHVDLRDDDEGDDEGNDHRPHVDITA